jgi:hypothetical protein
MAAKTLPLMFACVLGVSFALLSVPTASAVTFNFNIPSGALGTTQSYMSEGGTVTAAGFSSPAALLAGVPNVNLFGKNAGAGEMGLGLVNDPSMENEIAGTSLIRLALGPGLTAPFSFRMNSTTGGETWRVSGSNSATVGFVPLLTGTDELSHTLAGPIFNFYTFDALIGNVLLASITAVPGPIVGAGLPGLIAACGALIALARRRRQRIA